MSKESSKQGNVQVRPPVVAVMGHIDHGKSSLLDYIRKANTTAKEAGGITQRMSAYKLRHKDADGKESGITFLDTPGHEAFSALRARGAQVADIAVLVVAADEGVKPQTVEAIKQIREAGLPFIVALNKIDKPNANPDRVKQGLAENDVYVEGFGGDISCVAVSATTGVGISDLLDMITLLAEVSDFKSEINPPAEGIVIEAQNSKQKGVGATLIIKSGSLKAGQFIVAGDALAPTRIVEDFEGKKITEAFPGDPVQISGFDKLPVVGTTFVCVGSKKEAEALALQNARKGSGEPRLVGREDALLSIPVIIKASSTDVIEAIIHEIDKIKNERVSVRIVATNIGFICESDVKLATTKPGSIILGFDTKIDASAKALAERDNVRIEIFDIIYKLAEWLENYMKENTPKMKMEVTHGKAKILKIFSTNKDKQVLGARVEEGAINLNDEVRILRRDAMLGLGRIRELQQSKTKTGEVKEGLECGAMIESKIEIMPGDKIESFAIEEK